MDSIQKVSGPPSRPGASPPRKQSRASNHLAPFFAAAAVVLAGALGEACSFDWEAYDPRLSSSGTAGPGSGGGASSGGPSGTGGMTSASTGDPGGTSGSGGAGTGGGMGGAGGSGGGGPSPCGGPSVLTEDFSDGVPGAPWWWSGDAGTTTDEVNGEGVITLPSLSPSSVYAAFQTKRHYDLRNDAVSVEVTQVTNPATSARTFLGVHYDGQNYLEIAETAGKIECVRVVGGVYLLIATTSYDPVADRFFRIREDGTNTYWETSPDGSNYVIRAQQLTSQLFSLSSVRLDLGTYLNGGEVNPGEAHFDNVNGGGVPTGKWCPASTLSDNFGDKVIGRKWSRFYADPGTALEETSAGTLTAVPPISMFGYCAVVSDSSYDLTGNALAVEVPKMVDPTTSAEAYFTLTVDGQGYVEIIQSNGTLLFRREKNGVVSVVGAVSYVPLQHRWWRIREQGGMTYWETSPNGMQWTIGGMQANPFPLTAVDVALGAGTWEPVLVPGDVQFDNLNLLP